MNIINALKTKYYHSTGQKYTKTIRRKQFNLTMSEEIIRVVRLIAAILGVPKYIACEHILQVGSYQVLQAINDPEWRDKLKEHLVKVHLLGDELKED